ncbi:MAG: hypothetical protein F9K23_15595 [Bacteroidetes bacterium]|nr:MAG: hypothetical protein F9K23_15595 [Bacteroidota bacterium]
MKIKFLLLLSLIFICQFSKSQNNDSKTKSKYLKGILINKEGHEIPSNLKIEVTYNDKSNNTFTKEIITKAGGAFSDETIGLPNLLKFKIKDKEFVLAEPKQTLREVGMVVLEIDHAPIFNEKVIQKGNRKVSFIEFIEEADSIQLRKLEKIINFGNRGILEAILNVGEKVDKLAEQLNYREPLEKCNENMQYLTEKYLRQIFIDSILKTDTGQYLRMIRDLDYERKMLHNKVDLLSYKFSFYGCQTISDDKKRIEFRILVQDSLNRPVKMDIPIKVAIEKITGLKSENGASLIKSATGDYYFETIVKTNPFATIVFQANEEVFSSSKSDYRIKVYYIHSSRNSHLKLEANLFDLKTNCFQSRSENIDRVIDTLRFNNSIVYAKIIRKSNEQKDIFFEINHLTQQKIDLKGSRQKCKFKFQKGLNTLTISNEKRESLDIYFFNKRDKKSSMQKVEVSEDFGNQSFLVYIE